MQEVCSLWCCSVPEHEDPLGFESVLSLHNVLSEVLTVVRDLSPHVVYEEGLGEEIFVVGVGHCLEVKGHGSTALDITDLEAAGGRVAVNIEELGHLLTVLREEGVAKVGFPLLIEVHNVVGLWAEEATDLLVGEHGVKNVNLIDGRLSTLISDAGGSEHGGGKEVDFPERSMREHHEGEASVGNEGTGPHVVGAVEAGADLVEIVASTHAPFPVVGAEHVGHVGEFGWVALSFGLE